MRGLAAMSISMMLVAGCGGRPTPARAAEPSCRDLAIRGEALIAQLPEAEREEALAFVAEVIDLCQAPGLALRARTCLTGAPTLAAARACPSLPATGDDLGDPAVAEAPSCEHVVGHAMTLLAGAPQAPTSAEELADEEAVFLQDCADVTEDGRRCAFAARTLEALDSCFEEHLDDGDDGDGDGEDDLDVP